MHVRGYGYGYVSDGPNFASIISVCHRKYIFLTRDGKMVRRKPSVQNITLPEDEGGGEPDILELKSLNGDDFFPQIFIYFTVLKIQ